MLNRADKVEQAIRAIKDGRTRGQFIREHTTEHDSIAVCQQWSDAYSQAMSEMERSNIQ